MAQYVLLQPWSPPARRWVLAVGVLEGEEDEGLLQTLGCCSVCKGCCGLSVVLLAVPQALWQEEHAEHCRGIPAQPLEPILQTPGGLGLCHITRALCGGERGGKHDVEGVSVASFFWAPRAPADMWHQETQVRKGHQAPFVPECLCPAAPSCTLAQL